jgi:DNA-binding Lrp family transcriptional regulator
LGGYLTVIVDVIMKQGGVSIIEHFKNAMQAHPAVQQCYYVTGNVDFIIMITAQNMLEYEKLTQQLFLNNDDIQKFHSSVVMDNVKVGLDIPV